jgi:hypothetical protein
LSKIQVIYPDNRATPPLHVAYPQQGDEALKKLVRDIFGKPKHKKHELGAIQKLD